MTYYRIRKTQYDVDLAKERWHGHLTGMIIGVLIGFLGGILVTAVVAHYAIR